MAGHEPAGVATAYQLAEQMEAQKQCRLGFHAWVPWLTVMIPDTNQVHSYQTWCAREGCDHQEQFDV